jgi:hypothetical protein
MPPDDLTALLEQIQKLIAARDELIPSMNWDDPADVARFNARQDKVAARVPSLVAALEAVLKLADTLEPQAPAASALEEDRMWIRQECADMIREAIRHTLTGQEAAQ